MTTIIRNLRSWDAKPQAEPCGCGGHDTKAATDGSFGTALDRALAPLTEAHVLATAALAHYGIDADSGKMTGHNARARALWGR